MLRFTGLSVCSTVAPTLVTSGGEWYGWQTLIADGVAIASTPFVPVVGVGVYLTGAPIVHLAHGNGARAGASLGFRLGAPLVGAVGGVVVRWYENRHVPREQVVGVIVNLLWHGFERVLRRVPAP